MRGYLEGRESVILSEQEQIRGALQKVINRYTVQVQTASEIAQAASSILETGSLLNTAVDLIRERFDLYYVGIFLVDEDAEWAILRAGTGQAGQKMLADGHQLRIGGESMIGQCVAQRQARIALDVGEEAVRFDNPVLPDTHSEIALPLISRNQVIGAMTVQSKRRGAFTSEDVTVLQTMADQLANAISNARLFEQVNTALRRTETLYKIGQSVMALRDLDELLQDVTDAVARTLPADRTSLITFDLEEEKVTHFKRGGVGLESVITEVPFDELWDGLSGWVLRERKPALSPKGAPDLRESPRVQQRRRETHCGSIVVVPMMYQDRLLGTMTAINRPDQPDFTQDDVELMTAMVNQAVAAIVNARLLGELRASTTMLQDVLDAMPNPVFYKDVDGAYQIVNDAFAQQVLGIPKERIEGATVYDLPEAIPPDLADIYHEADMALIREPGFQEYEAQVKYADGQRHDVLFTKTTLRSADGTIMGMVGVMLDVTERNRAEEERERLLLELEDRAVQLMTASEVARAASSILVVESLLDAGVDLIRRRFNLYYVGLFLVDDEGKWAVLRAGTGEAGRRMIEAGHQLEVGSDSMIGQCVATQEARIALDVGEEATRFDNPLLPNTHSELALPLVSRGRAIGAMTIQSEETAAFSEDDVIILQTMADQLANAIENARLFEETQYNLKRTQALYEANRAMTSVESVSVLLQQVVDNVAEALNAQRVVLYTIDMEAQEVLGSAGGGRRPDLTTIIPFDELMEGLTGWVLQERKPALSPRSIPDPRESPRVRQRRREDDAGSIIVVPLLYRDERLGTLTAINGLEEPEFTEDDADLMMAMANQAAAAIKNVRLLEDTQEALARTEALYRVGRSVMTIRDLGAVLQEITDLIAEILPADRTSLMTFDLQTEEVVHFVRGGPGRDYLSADISFEELWSGLSGWVLREREPALSLKGEPDPRESAEVRQRRLEMDSGSIIVVPIVYQDEILGTVTAINRMDEPDFTEEDVELMVAMVNQTATSIVNAQRLQEVERRAVQLQTASEISEAATSILDIGDLLPEAVRLIRDRFDLYYAGVFLLDDTREWATLGAGTGEAGQRMIAAGHRLRVDESSMIGACIVQNEPRIALDVGEEGARFDNPYLSETRSELALPLSAHGEVLGAMSIQSTQQRAFSDEDIVVLETMARQLANAISNARLFAEAQARLEDLQKLQRQLTGEMWTEYVDTEDVVGYTYDLSQIEPLRSPPSIPVSELADRGLVTEYREGDGASLLAPITLHDEPIGVLHFEEPDGERMWTEDEIALVEAVRDQLALALENRLLFEQTRETLAETSSLYEVSREIGAAQSLQEIFKLTVEGLGQRPEPSRVVFGLLDPIGDPRDLRVVQSWSRDGGSDTREGAYPLGYWMDLYQILEQEGRFITSDVMKESVFDKANLDVYRQIGVRGMAAFQVTVRDMPYGMVFVYTREVHGFTEEEVRFYETVIRTASVALENLVLLKSTQEEAERRAFLNEVMQRASASLDSQDLMEGVGELIAQHFDMPTLVWSWDGHFAYPVAIYRQDGSYLLMDDSHFKLGDIPGVGTVIRLRRPVLWSFDRRLRGHPNFEQLLDKLELEEAFSAPLIVRDEVLGVLTLARQAGHPSIDDNEMAVLRNAAVNVSVALENARLYQEAQETAERLKEVDRLKSEFLANMSHELRTPLNSIIGFSRVILKGIDGPLTEMQTTDLQAIHDSGKHLLNLINDVLDLSKIEAGKMEFVFEPTDIREVVQGVLTTAIALVKERPVDLQQDLPEDLPLVLADERRIRQVILNLVGNAAKFTEQGYIRVSAERQDGEILIAVEDTGIGIPVEKYDEVFQEFRQVDSSSTRRYGGTGLGLPVSKKFVEAHGGRIWFESEVGKGTIFYISLPLDGPSAEKPEGEVQGEGKLILTVDDDEGVITLFRRYLEQQGYRVVGLTRGERVVDEVKRLQPYAVTLDILLPDANGWQIIQNLRSDPETQNVPIVVCSIVSDRDRGLSMGVTDYLVKPILEQDLLDALARLSDVVSPSKILVVDDNPDDRNLLLRILEEVDYEVVAASGGAEAIMRIHSDPPDVIVLDLMMPDVDGFAVLESLKRNKTTRDIPVIVVTAKDLTVIEREFLLSRVESLLQKGIFDQGQLLGDVAAVLERLASP
ncbi:MAG: GAF domain-containing protein [Anaerolineae bacterium]